MMDVGKETDVPQGTLKHCQLSGFKKTSRAIEKHSLKRNRHVEHPSLELIVVQLVKTSDVHAEQNDPQDQTNRSDHKPE
jgi:hypothetical protein